MNAPSIVHIARKEDFREVMRLLHLGHAENGIFPYDLDKVEHIVARMLCPEEIPEWDTGMRGIIGAIGTPEHLEGLAFLVIGRFWYAADTERHLEEFIVYVDPEHRRSRHHRALIEWMKEQSRLTGIPLVTGILSGPLARTTGISSEGAATSDRTETKVKLYERMLPKAGAFFYFNPLTAASSAAHVTH